ncbi:Trans-cinnamate 4-monooxygenase [Glycine max]|nr:Trans-cinnamate 4-monooxygenase [Glycine max]
MCRHPYPPSCWGKHGYIIKLDGVLDVSASDISNFCNNGCKSHTLDVLSCIQDVKRDFYFGTKQNVSFVRDAIINACAAPQRYVSSAKRGINCLASKRNLEGNLPRTPALSASSTRSASHLPPSRLNALCSLSQSSLTHAKRDVEVLRGGGDIITTAYLDPAEGGYEIPTESKILVNAWWLANNPAHWKKPEKFRPERFLEEELHVEANGNDFRYLPFGVGRRSCPGIILALPILAITLGRLVQNFELLPPPGQSQIDTSEKGGQFSLHILKHSTIVAKPRLGFVHSSLMKKCNCLN